MRDGLENVAVGRDVADGPLAKPRAAQPEDVTPWLGDAVLLQACLDLVVGQECDIARMRHGQYLPVAQERRPWLKQPAT